MITTDYGSWNTLINSVSLTPGHYIAEQLANPADFDMEAIEADYLTEIYAALPSGVTLQGGEFIGPHDPDGDAFDGYPTTDDGGLDIPTIIESIDLWEIIRRHEHIHTTPDSGDSDHRVNVYEDNAGAVYLERGRAAWALGPVTPDMNGTATECANAWHTGNWAPNEDDGQTATAIGANLVLIGTWTPERGLVVVCNSHGDVVAGAAGQAFLGEPNIGGSATMGDPAQA